MKNIGFVLSEMFSFLVVKFSLYLIRRVFVMIVKNGGNSTTFNQSHTNTK